MKYQDLIKKHASKNKPEVFGALTCFQVKVEDIVGVCQDLSVNHKLHLKTITAQDLGKEFKIIYIFGVPKEHVFLAPYILVKESFPSVTPIMHEASNYERKIKTLFGLTPKGHPSLRSIILHENWPDNVYPLRKSFNWKERPQKGGVQFQFRKMIGEGIYEIPVGPVHAGIIEPGHFRFSVAGEEILMLEPRLGYTHKGSEKLFEVLSLEEKVKLAERISGDSSFSHALAFCQAVEQLGKIEISEREEYLRVIFAELERVANHLGDIGAIMTDTGFNFGGAQGGRLREIVMQINEKLTGSRFLRGVIKIGGVNADLTSDQAKKLAEDLEKLKADFSEVIKIAMGTGSLLTRLKKTGVLNERIARDHGALGVAGRAVGFEMDARVDYPYAAYDKIKVEVAKENSGDVYARFRVRVQELLNSIEILKQALWDLPKEEKGRDGKDINLEKNSYSIGVVEGWRGDIVYLVATDSKGQITRVDVRDPSFINWTVLGHAGQGNMVPDFPLINKSFNLSYTGNDL